MRLTKNDRPVGPNDACQLCAFRADWPRMKNRSWPRLLFFLFSIVAAALPLSAAEKRNITEKDLFDFVWVGDAQVSPDGARVAFVRVTVNEKKEGYNTSIWMVATTGNELPHRLTTGERDSSPRWSPDGKFLAFTRTTEKDGKPEPPQLFMLSMAGGDAFPFTSLPKGAGDPKWSPDGKLIVFASSTNPEDLEKQEKKKRKEEELKRAAAAEASPTPSKESAKEKSKPADDAAKKAEAESERESDIHVVTRAVYRSNDEGYLDFKRPQHFWLVPAPRNADEKVQPKQLTSGRFDEDGAIWSKDGKKLLCQTVQGHIHQVGVDGKNWAQRRTVLRSGEDGDLLHPGEWRRAHPDHHDRHGRRQHGVESGWKAGGLPCLGCVPVHHPR